VLPQLLGFVGFHGVTSSTPSLFLNDLLR
jgi:hypothetical protein